MEHKYRIKIFLVDSDSFCLNIYQRQLTNLGYNDVTRFDTDISCLHNLEQQPDVVFLDHSMGIINQQNLLRQIKRFNPGIYVVFTSAPEHISAVTNSLKYGAFDYVIKKDHELEGVSKVLASIWQIGELLKNTRPNFIKRSSH